MILFFLTAFFCSLLSPLNNHKIQIEFQGMQSDRGSIMLRVVDEQGEKVRGDIIKLSNGKSYSIELPTGKYAISVYHDENDNRKLDTNFLGIPTEKYGFSNNVRGTFGPPKLSKQLFEVKKSGKITILLK